MTAGSTSIKADEALTILSVPGLIINPGEIASLFIGCGIMIVVALLLVI